jgi:sensor histidine kinase YesM
MINTQFRFIRFVLLPLSAMVFSTLGYVISLTDDYGRQFVSHEPYRIVIDITSSIVYTLICSEISLRLFLWLQRFFSLETRLRMLILVHLLLTAFIWIVVFTVSQILLFGYDSSEKIFMIKSNILFALIVAIGINSVLVGMGLFERWKLQIQETENAKRVSLEAQNAALQQQIDPHFLFNSLNTLTALIEEEPLLATKFVKELSNVYRYVLQSKDHELVLLQSEIDFIKAYTYLHELRFGENLHVIFHLENAPDNVGLPPLSLQMCIENAVKHNVISKRQPLTIRITAHADTILIENSLQPKRNLPTSTKVGLDNIRRRYALLTDREVHISNSAQSFEVRLPLLEMKTLSHSNGSTMQVKSGVQVIEEPIPA